MGNIWAINEIKKLILGELNENTDLDTQINLAINGDNDAFANLVLLLQNEGLSFQEAYNQMIKACGTSTQNDSKAKRINKAGHAKKIASIIRDQYANGIEDKKYVEK